MEITKRLVAFVLVILAVLTLFIALSTGLGEAGLNLLEKALQSGSTADCALREGEDARQCISFAWSPEVSSLG